MSKYIIRCQGDLTQIEALSLRGFFAKLNVYPKSETTLQIYRVDSNERGLRIKIAAESEFPRLKFFVEEEG